MNIVCIPARYGSTRLPKKALIKIGQECLIEHVFKRCQTSKLADRVVVLTDHQAIFDEVKRFSNDVVMTDSTLPSGTDRVCVGAGIIGAKDDDFIINVQGDQAFMQGALIDELIGAYQQHKNPQDIAVFTLINPITDTQELDDPGVVKVVFDRDYKALYFSRSRIPHQRDKGVNNNQIPYYKHLGIYGYTYRFLQQFVSYSIGTLEQIEQLEQLRVLEQGHKIALTITDKTTMEINYPEDVKKVLSVLQEKE